MQEEENTLTPQIIAPTTKEIAMENTPPKIMHVDNIIIRASNNDLAKLGAILNVFPIFRIREFKAAVNLRAISCA